MGTRHGRRSYALIPPLYIEREYASFLRGIVDEMEELTKTILIPHLAEIESRVMLHQPKQSYVKYPSDSTSVTHIDTWPDDVGKLVSLLSTSLNELSTKVKIRAEVVGEKVNQWHDRQWGRLIQKAIGVRLLTREPWLVDQMKTFTNTNVALITKMSSNVKDDINRIVQHGFTLGKRHETIAKEILSDTKLTKGVFNKAKTRAGLIGRDQVTKLNGNINRLRQSSLGISKYIWRTSLDERVRTSHDVMENRVCRWDNATVYQPGGSGRWIKRPSSAVWVHPGEDYQCRCYGEPIFEDVEKELQIGALR